MYKVAKNRKDAMIPVSTYIRWWRILAIVIQKKKKKEQNVQVVDEVYVV
jgi:hypothetical protein